MIAAVRALLGGFPPILSALVVVSSGSLEAQAQALPQNGTYSFTQEVPDTDEDSGRSTREKVESFLSVELLNPDRLKFCLFIADESAHTCTMEGEAVRKGAVFEYADRSEESKQAMGPGYACVLRISWDKRSLIVQDVDDACRQLWCGARAGIATTRFPRSTRREEIRECE